MWRLSPFAASIHLTIYCLSLSLNVGNNVALTVSPIDYQVVRLCLYLSALYFDNIFERRAVFRFFLESPGRDKGPNVIFANVTITPVSIFHPNACSHFSVFPCGSRLSRSFSGSKYPPLPSPYVCTRREKVQNPRRIIELTNEGIFPYMSRL